MASTPEARVDLDLIRSVQLPPLTSRPATRLLVQGDTPAGYVDAGGSISFAANVTGQARQDILDSTLFAQLGADHDYDREASAKLWYGRFTEILRGSCWFAQEFSFTTYDGKTRSFTVMDVIVDVLLALLTEDARIIAENTLKALKALSRDDHRIVVFEEETHTANEGNFQIGSANETGGAISLSVGGFYFSVTKHIDRLLWFEFDSDDVTFWKGTQIMTLNQEQYAEKARKLIRDKLGARIEQFIASVDIGPPPQ
jgi:hypothetical protein